MSAPFSASRPYRDAVTSAELVDFREVPLGGPRAMLVRRTLPQHGRSLIGAWCFLDHYGPDDVAVRGGMRVAGHPHTGLQTASWLFSGEIEHRDTTGSHALVRPGELNLMTAGRGIAHSEYSTPATTVLHGAQLWIALPNQHRFTAPGFTHYVPPVVDRDGWRMLVFLGTVDGAHSPVATYSPLAGAEFTIDRPQRVALAADPSFEYGLLVDNGTISCAGISASSGQLIYLPPGASTISFTSPGPAKLLLLGGAPLNERIVMWWNFIGRDHDEIAQLRSEWESAQAGAPSRFGPFPGQWAQTIPAPPLPNLRLRPRD